jgi:hypothetical protein
MFSGASARARRHRRFLFDLLDADDEYFVMTFNHRPHMLTSWTSTPGVVRQRLNGVKALGGTAAYDAVLAALPMFAKRTRERGALVIISDGADTASDASLRDLHSALARSDVFVYAIAIDSPESQPINTRPPHLAAEITDDSGGRTEIVRSSREIADATARIAEGSTSSICSPTRRRTAAMGSIQSSRAVRGTDARCARAASYVATPLVALPGRSPVTRPRRHRIVLLTSRLRGGSLLHG